MSLCPTCRRTVLIPVTSGIVLATLPCPDRPVPLVCPGPDRYPSMTGWKRASDTGHKGLMTGVILISVVIMVSRE
eukprot:COSAG02_NODE_3148_length_7286_cov_24.818700_2_plen_75_part_00